MDTHVIWALLVAFALTAYTVFDGFDLGVGLLVPFIARAERAPVFDAISPVWDGNETWLVLAGVGLFAAFPVAYSVLLPAFYLPLLMMIMGLVLRGVALEMSYANPDAPGPWNAVFSLGSCAAASCQGLLAGALLTGVKVAHLHFAGRPQDVLTPLGLLLAGALPVLYALLGASWLYLKITGPLQQRVRRYAFRLMGVALVLGLAVVVVRQGMRPYSSAAGALQLAAFGALALAAGRLRRQRELTQFCWLVVLVALADTAALVGLWPYMVPPSLTLWQVAAPTDNTPQLLVTLGAVMLIISYLGYSYYVFQGKVGPGQQIKRRRYQVAVARQLEPVAARPEPAGVVLPLAVRLLLVPVGGLVFLLLLGSFGTTPALVVLVLLLALFVGAWLRYDHPDSETGEADSR
jgi:cytochrome d ubiquinol oxidase subunit II